MWGMAFDSIAAAIEEIRAGRMIVIVDDEDRENEGDLAMAADAITPEAINFMAVHGRGLICLALAPDICDRLALPQMSRINTSNFGTAFTESIDAREGVSTGISASDRALTISLAMKPDAKADDFARPGHVFPLRAQAGGVLVRAGQTEAAVDLSKLADRPPGGVICEIMNPDGTMARLPQLRLFCLEHGLKLVSVADLIRYRLENENYVRVRSECQIDTRSGRFRMLVYENVLDGEMHAALVCGSIDTAQPVLVRMHTHCLFGDLFRSSHCDCRALLDRSMELIQRERAGVIVYLHLNPADRFLRGGAQISQLSPHTRQAPRNEGTQKLQHQVGIGAQILRDLNCRRIRLLSNSPIRAVGLEGFGIEIFEQVPVDVATASGPSAN